jgi:hypothetical protein
VDGDTVPPPCVMNSVSISMLVVTDTQSISHVTSGFVRTEGGCTYIVFNQCISYCTCQFFNVPPVLLRILHCQFSTRGGTCIIRQAFPIACLESLVASTCKAWHRKGRDSAIQTLICPCWGHVPTWICG